MKATFWYRPIPALARRLILWVGGIILAVLAISIAVWVHFHQGYDQWLNTPPERLQGHPHVLIMDSAVVAPASDDQRANDINEHLITWWSDHSHIVEMSRSDVFTYGVLNRAWVKVFLHTRAPDADNGGRRVEFVSVFRREDGHWIWLADHNLALE